MKKFLKSFLISALSVVGLFCAVPNAMCKEVQSAPSYYTVKTENELISAVSRSNKGDTIIIIGDIELNSTLTIPSGKDLTIANDREVRTIKRGNTRETMIQINQGSTLTLKGINGTDENPSLLIDGDGNNKNSKFDGRIVTNSGTFNMYTGVSLQNNKMKLATLNGNILGCAVFCSGNSTFNMYSGSISRNQMIATGEIDGHYGDSRGYCLGVIYLSSGSTFNMSGGIISNNTSSTIDPLRNHGIIYCGKKSYLNISGGEISKNNAGIYCESNAVVNMTNGRITENEYGIYSLGKVIMSGGSVANNKKAPEMKTGSELVLLRNAQNVQINICSTKKQNIVIDGLISWDKDSFMNISMPEYIVSGKQKTIDAINRAKLSSVVGTFRLSFDLQEINCESYADDGYQDFEKTDANTGIKISSCESVLSKDVEISITKVDSIDNVKDTTFYIESMCDNVKSLYSVKFTSNGKQYVPEETREITFYIPIKEFDTGKIPEVKLLDCNKKTISEGGEIKAVKGLLYIKIPTTADSLQ